MTEQELINTVELPKWPGIIVTGKPVTKEQAWEIIIRTHSDYLFVGGYLCTNSFALEKEIIAAMRFPETVANAKYYEGNERFYDVVLDALKSYHELDLEGWAKQTYNPLCLEYLDNARLASAWIDSNGKGYGWCDWDGVIGCNNYNIGKWPDTETIYNEWVLIAKEFPFLELNCSVLNCEICQANEPDAKILIEYVVSDGNVKAVTPLTHTPDMAVEYDPNTMPSTIETLIKNENNSNFDYLREKAFPDVNTLNQATEYVRNKIASR